MCFTHMCDLEYTISVVRWMLSEGKSYESIRISLQDVLQTRAIQGVVQCFQWKNDHQLKNCGVISVCVNIITLSNYFTAQCMADRVTLPKVNLDSLVKVEHQQIIFKHNFTYLCKTSLCNSKETHAGIIEIMWNQIHMLKIFQSYILTSNLSNDQTSIISTTVEPIKTTFVTTSPDVTTESTISKASSITSFIKLLVLWLTLNIAFI
ncbi:unnamed protein product [Adineta ricciae]|uniref:Uncharacterized protein n=1 Tax=Adineta ricciae TaxID=249248 RepID=A0A815QJ20_ADIRI|nr:unnamed protein product [Adineta ricciae]CAF1464014.1 unnamed protein product [Adineta ricciae]